MGASAFAKPGMMQPDFSRRGSRRQETAQRNGVGVGEHLTEVYDEEGEEGEYKRPRGMKR